MSDVDRAVDDRFSVSVNDPGPRRVRVIMNPRSGVAWSVGSILSVIDRAWNRNGIELTYQFSRSATDGRNKALRAVEEGIDTVLAVGGDGVVNSVGSALIGTDVALGVVPAGSGNGFARSFDIPLSTESAVRHLKYARRRKLDVGMANGKPFFVTCSMAWDAALVRTFDKSPVRGILPYVFAAVYEFVGYNPQPFTVLLDDSEEYQFEDPVVFTAANLTQFGGGARIAPQACPDDGWLELVVMLQKDMPRLLTKLNKLFDGTINTVPEVLTRRFRKLQVRRENPGPIQLDGDIVETDSAVTVKVLPGALTALVPETGAMDEVT